MSTKNEIFKSEAAHLEEAAFSAGYVPGTEAERKLVRRIDIRFVLEALSPVCSSPSDEADLCFLPSCFAI